MQPVSRKRKTAGKSKYDGPVMFDNSKYGDMLADPELWEQKWSEDLKNRWEGPRSRWGSILANMSIKTSPEEAKVWIGETNLLDMHSVISQVCQWQNDFGVAVARRALTSDYEREWLALSDGQRRKIVLAGICRAMRTEAFIPGRGYCPDSTLENLASAHGETYLKYLRQIIPDDLGHKITDPKTIPHPIVDRYLAVRPSREGMPGYKAMVKAYQVARIQCLTGFISEIFDTFVRRCSLKILSQHTLTFVQCGKPYRERAMIKGPRGTTATLGQFTPFVDGLTDAHVRHMKREWVDRKRAWKPSCWYCRKSSATKPDIKLSACTKCRDVGRTILYCSR